MKSRLAAIAFVLALIGLAPATAQAGGTGDFYKTASCYPDNQPKALMTITNYDDPTGQTYHIVLRDYAPTGIANTYYAWGMLFDGAQYHGTDYGSYIEKFIHKGDRASHTITGQWMSWVLRTCSRTL